MLSRLLHVRHHTAKQAVITAIDLLGLCSVCYCLLFAFGVIFSRMLDIFS